MDAADNIRRIKEQAKLPKTKNVYKIPAKSAKKLKKEAEEKGVNKATGGSELDRWFQARRKEMQGHCLHCGEKTTKHQDQWYKCGIAHLLPKNIFKSIKTHPLNWIELCFWKNNCHGNFDNHMIDITELNCYDLVIERFIAMYPDIAPKERKYIPEALLQYVKNETDTL
jgi:hypothetical protein